MQSISRHRPKRIKLIGRVWYNVINVALDGWRERRLDVRDIREEIEALSLGAILLDNNATDADRDTNFEGIPTLQLCYDMGQT